MLSCCPPGIVFETNGFQTCPASTPVAALNICMSPYQTHLIQLISTFVETAKPELGVSDKGDKKCQG